MKSYEVMQVYIAVENLLITSQSFVQILKNCKMQNIVFVQRCTSTYIFIFHTEIVFSTLHYHILPIHLQVVLLYYCGDGSKIIYFRGHGITMVVPVKKSFSSTFELIWQF